MNGSAQASPLRRVCFRRVCLIGMGLIGSSIARAIKQRPVEHIDQGALSVVGTDASPEVRERVHHLGIVDEVFETSETAVVGADLVILCVPVGATRSVVEDILPALLADQSQSESGRVIISDVGSTKQSAIEAFAPLIDKDQSHNRLIVIPAHPVAGTENSGPDSGFAELFVDRWCVLTPARPNTPPDAIVQLMDFWRALGAMPDVMAPDLHDRILAITSHIPQMIAYTAVGTIHDFDSSINENVFRFAASGFRDMTRLAGSDPTMWRDVYLNNKDYVLEMLQRFSENLALLQRAIRFDDGETLHTYFTQTRNVHQQVVKENQAEMEDVKQRRLARQGKPSADKTG